MLANNRVQTVFGLYARMRAMPWRCMTRYIASSIAGYKKPVRVDVWGVSLQLRPGSKDLLVAAETLSDEFDVPMSYFKPDFNGFIIDAGGYIGTAAIQFARRLPSATIYTIEPSPSNFALLVENTRPYPNIVPIHAAITKKSGFIDLLDRRTGQWGFTIVERPDDVKDAKSVNRVPAVTLSDLATEYSFASIGLMKMDIEGAEFQLLEISENWIDNVEVLVVELHERICPGVEMLFEEKTKSRINLKLPGEKLVSIRRRSLGFEAESNYP